MLPKHCYADSLNIYVLDNSNESGSALEHRYWSEDRGPEGMLNFPITLMLHLQNISSENSSIMNVSLAT